nr:hypothetical protein [Cronobacter malonaticus]
MKSVSPRLWLFCLLMLSLCTGLSLWALTQGAVTLEARKVLDALTGHAPVLKPMTSGLPRGLRISD